MTGFLRNRRALSGGALAAERYLYAPRVWSIYCRGKRRPPCTRNSKARKRSPSLRGSSNRPGQEFRGDWGACSPHHHPYPPAYPSRPPQPAAALPPRPLPPPTLPTVTRSATLGRRVARASGAAECRLRGVLARGGLVRSRGHAEVMECAGADAWARGKSSSDAGNWSSGRGEGPAFRRTG